MWSGPCVSQLSHCCDRIPYKNRFILAQSLGVQSILIRKAGWLELEAALYIVSTIRKQRQISPAAWLTVSSQSGEHTHSQWDGAIQYHGGNSLS